MADKKTQALKISRAMERISSPSVFDTIVKQVVASEIPTEYIERILVHYKTGNTVELSGCELTHPIPVNGNGNSQTMSDMYSNIREVQVFVDTEKLESDINEMVENLLGNHC